jgi:hypothetical protein
MPERHLLFAFLGNGLGYGGLALDLLPLFFAFASAVYFCLSFTHGMLLLSKEMAILKPAHYIRDGLICQYGEKGRIDSQ